MSGPREDDGSRTVEDAARFELWRALRDDPPDDDGAERPRSASYRNGRREPTHCTCTSRSEEPCDFCSMEGP